MWCQGLCWRFDYWGNINFVDFYIRKWMYAKMNYLNFLLVIFSLVLIVILLFGAETNPINQRSQKSVQPFLFYLVINSVTNPILFYLYRFKWLPQTVELKYDKLMKGIYLSILQRTNKLLLRPNKPIFCILHRQIDLIRNPDYLIYLSIKLIYFNM